MGMAVKLYQISKQNLKTPAVYAQGVNADVEANAAIAPLRSANLEQRPAIELQHLVRKPIANCFEFFARCLWSERSQIQNLNFISGYVFQNLLLSGRKYDRPQHIVTLYNSLPREAKPL